MDCIQHSKNLENGCGGQQQPQQQQQQQQVKCSSHHTTNYQQKLHQQQQQQQELLLNYNNYRYSAPALPIDDFHLLENPNKYSEEEKQLRIKLAAVYRLIEIHGWSMAIYNHVTVSNRMMTS